MPPEEIVPICSNCQTPLNKIKGKFGEFWGCPNYKECGFKGFSADKPRPKDKPEVRIPETTTGTQIIMDEIHALNKKFEDFEAGFADKMGNLKKILIIINGKLK